MLREKWGTEVQREDTGASILPGPHSRPSGGWAAFLTLTPSPMPITGIHYTPLLFPCLCGCKCEDEAKSDGRGMRQKTVITHSFHLIISALFLPGALLIVPQIVWGGGFTEKDDNHYFYEVCSPLLPSSLGQSCKLLSILVGVDSLASTYRN